MAHAGHGELGRGADHVRRVAESTTAGGGAAGGVRGPQRAGHLPQLRSADGYVVAYTSNVSGFSFQTFWGGTSFASPQMNGVTALLSQATHQRVGLLNVPLYLLAASGGYHGRNAPLRDITNADNWYWNARPGYDQASGLGVPDVANLLEALRDFGF